MASARIEAFEESLRRTVRPRLKALGFECDSKARTFRRRCKECMQIINFQTGVRSLEGRFAVNLGAYHPAYRADADNSPVPEKPREYDCLLRERLSILRDTPFTKLGRRLVLGQDTFLKWWLTTPTDRWWRLSEKPEVIDSELGAVLELLLTRGIKWLDDHTSEESLRAAHSKLRPVRADT